ncbi:MAG: acyltransferase [Bacteroidales bacterium]|nr:acyltransferase [Bacteroidales bacterium]MBD5294330.1 acyltransferase [Bacteroides sp.]MBD5342739.1 acyltransferase [Bacteroides sp.]MBD5360109.1 acyltransferase [Bacteroides sp.]MBD5361564.1 acyltransferase [Bacteroides sp.]
MNKQDFSDIAPFDDSDFRAHILNLVEQPEFANAVTWVFPELDFATFAEKLKLVDSQESFQLNVMCPILEKLVARSTDGLTCDGIDNYRQGEDYTLISNHRDIVLDASFLNLCLVRHGLPTCEVAIGNNLLIMPWIDELVRLNKSFIVKRDTGMRGALEAAKHLSAYIHYCITEKKQSLWIAQREGRAKDSNDRTQDSLLKMLELGGEGTPLERLREVNLMPVSISYEYDPNDYLKASEFVQKRRDANHKKSPKDDLRAMETGIMRPKGRIHYSLTECLNPQIDALPQDLDRSQAAHAVAELIDRAIHSNYKLYPINYVAYDMLEGGNRFADQYTAADVDAVKERLATQIGKCRLDNVTDDEREYMRELILTMYSNPLKNKLFR